MDKPNGLALEYKRDYGTASRNIKVSDLVNNPMANSECRVLGLGFAEQFWNNRLVNFGALFEDTSNSSMIAGDIAEHLPDVFLFQADSLIGHIEADAVKHER